MDLRLLRRGISLLALLFLLFALPRAEAEGIARPELEAVTPPIHVKFYYDKLTTVDGKRGVEHAIATLGHFDLVIVREPGETDAEEEKVTTALLKQGVELFGYVDLLEVTIPEKVVGMRAKIVRIAQAGYTGVFLDDAGYDFKVPRRAFNETVAFAHGLGLKVMINAWHPTDVLEDKVDLLMNPLGIPTALGEGDWVLLESFYHRSDDLYAGDPEGGFRHIMEKYAKVAALARQRGVKVATLTYHPRTRSLVDQSDRVNSLLLAIMLGLDGWAYGRSDNNDRVPWRTMPQLSVGQFYYSPLMKIGPEGERWIRITDRAVIWFEAVDQPVQRRAGIIPLGIQLRPEHSGLFALGWER